MEDLALVSQSRAQSFLGSLPDVRSGEFGVARSAGCHSEADEHRKSHSEETKLSPEETPVLQKESSQEPELSTQSLARPPLDLRV